MAKKRAKSEAAIREAQAALRQLADAVHDSAKDDELPKKLRKALREVEPLIDRAERKLDKRQSKFMKVARKERERRAAEADAAAKAKATAAAAAKTAAAKASAPAPRRQGPGTTPRTSIAGARARKRARR